jgi:prevent-host-death family protein
MKFLSVRDLRGQSAQVWRDLPEEGDMVITSNGRPVAVLSSVNEANLEESLSAWRQVRATRAVASLQKSAVRNGVSSLSMEEIDAEISATRKSRKEVDQ